MKTDDHLRVVRLEDQVRHLNAYCNQLYGYMAATNRGQVPRPPELVL